MKNVPNRVFVQVGELTDEEMRDADFWALEPTFSEERVFQTDIEFVRADVIKQEIKRHMDKNNDAGCELIINPENFDDKVWQTKTDFNQDGYKNWVKSAVAVLQNIYDDIDGLIDDAKLYILGDVINLLDCADVKVKNGNKEYIGVKQSPKVTFPRVNIFDEGSSYRR